jgi:hypothetical protein
MKSLKSFDSFGNVNEGVSREQLSTALTALGFSVNENPNFDAPKLRGSVHMTVLEKVTAAGLYRAVLDSEGETDSCGAEFFCFTDDKRFVLEWSARFGFNVPLEYVVGFAKAFK